MGIQTFDLNQPQTSKFRVGDKVMVVHSDGSRSGPYYIASVVSVGIYTLSHSNGAVAEEGEAIEEKNREAA
jgi:hypothetical protein